MDINYQQLYILCMLYTESYIMYANPFIFIFAVLQNILWNQLKKYLE